MKVEYDSNNSGGSWWLDDKDWIALEQAGWYVMWGGTYFCGRAWNKNKPLNHAPCDDPDQCEGHRICESYQEVQDRELYWLGAVAQDAYFECDTVTEAMQSFEKATSQDICCDGCNCCGPPHNFSWEYDKGVRGFASGSSCLGYLYPDRNIPGSLRDAVEGDY